MEIDNEVPPGKQTTPYPGKQLYRVMESEESQPVDLQAAIYKAKGKAKESSLESRSISGTARDVGNAA